MSGVLADSAGAAVLADVVGERSVRTLRPRASLFHEGDPSQEAYFVHDGLLKIVTTAADGSQALVAFRGPNGLVGEYAAIEGVPRTASATAVVETAVTPISRERLLTVLRNDPDTAISMLSSVVGHVRTMTDHVLALATDDPLALVARRLVQFVSDPIFASIRTVTNESVSLSMPVSQLDLGRWAGVSHRSVGTSLRQLRCDGLISTARLRLEVHDVEALAARAGS